MDVESGERQVLINEYGENSGAASNADETDGRVHVDALAASVAKDKGSVKDWESMNGEQLRRNTLKLLEQLDECDSVETVENGEDQIRRNARELLEKVDGVRSASQPDLVNLPTANSANNDKSDNAQATKIGEDIPQITVTTDATASTLAVSSSDREREGRVPVDKHGGNSGAARLADETDTTASTSAVSSPEASEITPDWKKNYVAPSVPRWRFVKEAKKSLGYSSTSAGTIVTGKSSHELGATYIAPEITHAEQVEKEDVGELNALEIKYSEFHKDQQEVGRLSVRELASEHEELYEGGRTISHDRKDSVQPEKHSRIWANFHPRKKDTEQTRNDIKDKWTTVIHDENDPNRLNKGVGELEFCPDDYLDEPIDGDFPQRKIAKSLYSGDGTDVRALGEQSPSENPAEDTRNPSEFDDEFHDNISNKADMSESETANPWRRRKMCLFPLLLLLLAAAIVGVVLGTEKSPGDPGENTRVSSVVAPILHNTTINPSSFPSANPSYFYSTGSSGGLFGVGTMVLPNTTVQIHSHGLFDGPYSFSPSNHPTTTLSPTRQPLAGPSQSPTSDPSNRPVTLSPTSLPTRQPSATPSHLPTSAPSERPVTLSPTPSPTRQPSAEPSQSPTSTPSNRPVTLFPTNQPIAFFGGCPEPFVTTIYYTIGTQVQSQGIVYKCKNYSCGTFGFEPGSVSGLWKEGWEIVGLCSGTIAPTTTRPTASPARQPTVQPSLLPTSAPSKRPVTLSPTPLPTGQPSVTPIQSPTYAPSNRPVTLSPTPLPTGQPSVVPSQAPIIATDSPTESPVLVTPPPTDTNNPTRFPSNAPSRVVTNKPTSEPSKSPFTSPSEAPIDQPTTSPSKGPSNPPTKTPSEQPSKDPTPNPSLDPSPVPTLDPTPNPSLEPTPVPTLDPTPAPSLEPTPVPTLDPTPNPTLEPSPVPTLDPTPPPTPPPTTPPPSKPPSQKPTNVPDPTKKPTDVPTLKPTCEENGNFNLCVAIDMSGSVCNDGTGSLCTECAPLASCNSGGERPTVCCPNFANMIEFTKSLVTSLGELPTDQDFSIVHFGTDVSVASTLESSRQSVKTLNTLTYTGGKTNLAGAINSCQLTLAASPPDRRNLMLIITDGAPSVPANAEEAATTAAINAKNQDTFIIPIFIEQNSFQTTEAIFLKNDISSDGKVFVADFDGLTSLQDTVFEQVTCQANLGDFDP
mmetsp:Transcript_17014/g.36663  ORF Transcript_17014/g.36663 Transcript_17014/m.36663 type:complete len:1197 (+) Transcript_17014:135-3725(+)